MFDMKSSVIAFILVLVLISAGSSSLAQGPGKPIEAPRDAALEIAARHNLEVARWNVTTVPGRCRWISRATAMPGYRWPPVPPPATTTARAFSAPVTARSRLARRDREASVSCHAPPTRAATRSTGCPCPPD